MDVVVFILEIIFGAAFVLWITMGIMTAIALVAIGIDYIKWKRGSM